MKRIKINNLTLFQFQLVRLKSDRTGHDNNRQTTVSIPTGSIKMTAKKCDEQFTAMFQFQLVRLKFNTQTILLRVTNEFQFQLVRLKLVSHRRLRTVYMFQFQLVRLKWKKKDLLSSFRLFVSIPTGSIKISLPYTPTSKDSGFNSNWFD